MWRKLTAVVVIAALAVAGAGCRKKPAQPAQPKPKTEVKSQVEYDSQAKKDINSENMQAEFDKIEKEVQQERSRGF
jgi:hypothetical protein